MTPEDFVRSMTPGMKQPENLGLDQFNNVSADLVDKLSVGVDESSIFYHLGSGRSINFFKDDSPCSILIYPTLPQAVSSLSPTTSSSLPC